MGNFFVLIILMAKTTAFAFAGTQFELSPPELFTLLPESISKFNYLLRGHPQQKVISQDVKLSTPLDSSLILPHLLDISAAKVNQKFPSAFLPANLLSAAQHTSDAVKTSMQDILNPPYFQKIEKKPFLSLDTALPVLFKVTGTSPAALGTTASERPSSISLPIFDLMSKLKSTKSTGPIQGSRIISTPVTFAETFEASFPNSPVLRPYFQTGDFAISSNGGGGGSVSSDNPVQPTGHLSQLPCILHVPNPIPITVTSGATQVTTHPTGTSAIPSAYIDNSPPTIGILRPPSSDPEFSDEPAKAVLPAASSTSTSNPRPLKSSTKSAQSHAFEENNNDDESFKFDEDLARNGFPLVYTLQPSFAPIISGTGAPPSSVPASGYYKQNKNSDSSSSSSPSSSSRVAQRKNPYFSVNKRKHFEYYEYF